MPPIRAARLGRTEDRVVDIDVRQDDLYSAEVQSLIAEHLSGMYSDSPPGHVHALYRRNGFECSGPFGEYSATDFNVFMGKVLV